LGTITDFRNKIVNLAAPNRFEVEMSFPAAVGAAAGLTEVCRFMCKAASIPGETIGQIEVPYHGMTLKLAGDREYSDWEVTVLNTEAWDVRTAMENWLRYIHDPVTNLKLSHASYQTNLKVRQLGINTLDTGNPVAVYEFDNAWLKSIGEIGLDFDSSNQVETFSCTFAYQYVVRSS
jgi:hypothetical protein